MSGSVTERRCGSVKTLSYLLVFSICSRGPASAERETNLISDQSPPMTRLQQPRWSRGGGRRVVEGGMGNGGGGWDGVYMWWWWRVVGVVDEMGISGVGGGLWEWCM